MGTEILPGVCYRTDVTTESYDEAIAALVAARDQRASIERHEYQPGCAVCGDSGHTVGTCHHDPLQLARCWTAAQVVYVCWHCGAVCTTADEAREHFGPNSSSLAFCQKLTGWAVVTAASHPKLHATLEDISHDCGAGAGHESYSVPPEWAGGLANYEQALAGLTDEQRQEFAIGDQAENDRMCQLSPALKRTGAMLCAFFNDWNST